MYPSNAKTLDDLFKVADENMYKLKSEQKESFQKRPFMSLISEDYSNHK